MIKQQHQAIASARAFLKDANFDNIVSMLNLECCGDWHFWQDSEGNKLRITKSCSVMIFPSKEDSSITKDLFRKAPPSLISRNSYWTLYVKGINENILTFLGNDGILRSLLFDNYNWICNFSPILLGFPIIKYIASSYIEDECVNVREIKINYPKQFDIKEMWGTPFPSNNKGIQEKICHLIAQNLKES
jgi:hypothetical protein